jgi:hypothetical protein
LINWTALRFVRISGSAGLPVSIVSAAIEKREASVTGIRVGNQVELIAAEKAPVTPPY